MGENRDVGRPHEILDAFAGMAAVKHNEPAGPAHMTGGLDLHRHSARIDEKRVAVVEREPAHVVPV